MQWTQNKEDEAEFARMRSMTAGVVVMAMCCSRLDLAPPLTAGLDLPSWVSSEWFPLFRSCWEMEVIDVCMQERMWACFGSAMLAFNATNQTITFFCIGFMSRTCDEANVLMCCTCCEAHAFADHGLTLAFLSCAFRFPGRPVAGYPCFVSCLVAW